MARDGGAADELIARIKRTVSDEVRALPGSAADPAAAAARVRAQLLGLLSEAEDMVRTLRAEATRWHDKRARAEQDASVETQLLVLASEGTQKSVAAEAERRAEKKKVEAARAEREERRVLRLLETLLAVLGSLRVMLARLSGGESDAMPARPPQPGGEHMARAAELVGEIDALNERAFQKIRTMRSRAAGMDATERSGHDETT
ncbi:MAG: hypothetical protein NVSMB65_09720 [Chloroflexota bacterium]